MKVKDIMTKSVASLNVEDTVERAAQLMKEYNVGSIPICDNKKVTGIITDRDIALRSVANGEDIQRQTVRSVMSSNPVVGNSDMDIHKAADIMSERQIRRLPIVEGKNIVGMVSLGDIAVNPKLENDAGEALSDISEPATPNM